MMKIYSLKISSSIYYTFWYLNQMRQESSTISQVLQQITPKAVEQVRGRLNTEDLFMQIYVRVHLSLVIKNATAAHSQRNLPALYDKLETKLKAFKSLGRTLQKFDDFC
ncbi:hypothetical protein CDAR_397591 [Caerostris darwini]|uniref:Uncharacterized protein n=1 Tax=Caerostris darwini TaxID=1538125 RepID=A0AAV4T652_9ARAC|nr:hypothetical protein CDAR_397591 [Caerostris darwini]